MPTTRDRWRNRLPHWEVEDRPHFLTIRCAGSLPTDARLKVREIHDTLQRIAPSEPDFARLQRRYFAITEKYLDCATPPFAPFRTPGAAQTVLEALADLESSTAWQVTHAVVMLNHIHFLARPVSDLPTPLRTVLRQYKGATARAANLILGRTGPFWQRDWFDRWMRSDAETRRVADYIAQNPVKAGLVSSPAEWPWTITP